MKRLLIGLMVVMNGLMVWGHETDTLSTDTLATNDDQGVIIRTIRGFDKKDYSYIEPNHYEFTFMMQLTRTYESFSLSSNEQSLSLSPDRTTKIGPYFGWRWIFLGYTFDIQNISFSQNGLRKEFDLSIYSSQVGVDLFYRRTGDNYKIRDAEFGKDVDGHLFEGIPFAGVNVGITGASAYYIFNHRRFSYPAAFAQSTCQKISCGSWMAGLGYTHNTLELDHEALQEAIDKRIGHTVPLDSGMLFRKISYNDFMLSGGYAYNWVFAKNWLFCASAQLALAYKTSHGKTADEKKGFDFKKVNPDVIGRFGLVYNNIRWYAGASFIMRTNKYSTSRFTANNIFGSLNVYIGFNFMLKKKYRQQQQTI